MPSSSNSPDSWSPNNSDTDAAQKMHVYGHQRRFTDRLSMARPGENVRSDDSKRTRTSMDIVEVAVCERKPHELRNLLCLAVIFCNYFFARLIFVQVSILAAQDFRHESEDDKSILDSIPLAVWLETNNLHQDVNEKHNF